MSREKTTMANFCDKKEWSEEEWEIYISRLEYVRKKLRFSKHEFSQRAGVRNLYRRDMKRPGEKALLGLERAFGIPKEWFCGGSGKPLEPLKLDLPEALKQASAEALSRFGNLADERNYYARRARVDNEAVKANIDILEADMDRLLGPMACDSFKSRAFMALNRLLTGSNEKVAKAIVELLEALADAFDEADVLKVRLRSALTQLMDKRSEAEKSSQ